MCRSHYAAAVILALLITGLGPLATAPPANAQTLVPNPVCILGGCDEDDHDSDKQGEKADDPGCVAAATLMCAGQTVVEGVGGAAGDAVGAGVSVVGDAAMDGLTSWVAGGASWLVGRVGQMLDRSTRPSLGSTWFTRQYRAMIELAVALAIVVLLCAVIQATLRQDIAMLLRVAFVALPLAMCLCFAGVTLVEIALGVTDWMTAEVLSNFEADSREFFKDVSGVLAPSALVGGPLPGFLLFLSAIFLAVMTFVVWLELIMREAAIYVAVAFLPLSFAAMIWQRTAHWCRRLVDGLLAIILSKFVIAGAIALAASALGNARGGDGGWTSLLAGTAVMLVAALAPWVLLRIIPFAETAAQSSLQRGSVRGAVNAAPGANSANMVIRLAMAKQFTSALAGGGAGIAAGVAAAPALRALKASPAASTSGAGANATAKPPAGKSLPPAGKQGNDRQRRRPPSEKS